MKRMIKRFSTIACVAGIVLLCVAVVLSIYVTASVGKPWARFNEMPHLGELSFADRVRFDGEYYTALSRAVAGKGQDEAARAESLRPCFSDFEARARAREDAAARQALEDEWKWYAEDFDVEGFLTFHAEHGNDDAREISGIVEYWTA